MTEQQLYADAAAVIRKFAEFLERHYYAALIEQARVGKRYVNVDFGLLARFDPVLADYTLEEPEDAIAAADEAVKDFDVGRDEPFFVRFINLPESSRLLIRNIRSQNLNKLFFFEGTVRNKSEVRPHVTTARFECPSCGNVIPMLQPEKKFVEPTKCSCGRKGKFRLLSKELVDAQTVSLEEAADQLEGGEQPKRITILLKNDLVSPLTERKTNPGQRILAVGVVKEVPIQLRSGAQSTKFDLIVEANSVDSVQEDFYDIVVDEKDKEDILAIAHDPHCLRRLAQSVAPSIYGHDKIKEALVLQLAGGTRKVRDDGVVTRGDIHVLLIGDPGSGKSQLLKRVSRVAPRGRFISGKGVSGAGLTASVVRDELLNGWSLEAGALVLAHRGVCAIDELDKMSTEDRSAMHEALEGQQITISKANIQATLRCETTVVAAANPKMGRFDPYDTVVNQIDLPPALINRFDLIFPVKDLPDAKRDEKLATFVLDLHRKAAQSETTEGEIGTPLFRKYIAYVRQNFQPILTEGAIDELRNYYISMRSSGKQTGSTRSIPISPRQLEGLVRMAEAHAKVRLSHVVEKEDAKKAIELLDHCLRLVAFDEATGTIDIDRIATDTPASKRNQIMIIKEIIRNLEKEVGKTIPLEDIVKAAQDKGLSEDEVEEIIQKMKRQGDLFEPKKGFISQI